jgi:hypothetical protein|tara:strand:- start:157 stop:672 length:516 start_codon:yes stop_codon:yes gene_type:complete
LELADSPNRDLWGNTSGARRILSRLNLSINASPEDYYPRRDEENMMNRLSIMQAPTLIAAMLLFSTGLIADQIPDPAASQKTVIDQMHHKLHDHQSLYKASEAQALGELNQMTIREGVSFEAINTKIDELMEAKKQIMRLRYAHLVEMREILTDEQKVGYDKGVLNRSAVK